MGNLLIYSAADNFCIWPQVLPRIVPFAAGGGSDITARLMGQWLSERLGRPFVIENRPGGAFNIGTEAVVKAPPDGYTLLLATTTNTINATLYDKLNFNFARDIAPVATISRYTWVMVVHPSFPAKTVPVLGSQAGSKSPHRNGLLLGAILRSETRQKPSCRVLWADEHSRNQLGVSRVRRRAGRRRRARRRLRGGAVQPHQAR